MFYDLRHLTLVGRFGGNNQLDNLRRNLIHAYGMSMTLAMNKQNRKALYRDLGRFKENPAEAKTASIDICSNCTT